MATCFTHPDRETGRHCTRCGRPACAECLHQAPVGSHCWECIKAAQPPRAEQIQRAWRGDPLLATKVIVGLNVAAFVLMALAGAGIGMGTSSIAPVQAKWGSDIIAIGQGEWWRLITSGFVHFGLLHIGMNMVILYRLGQDFEAALGRFRFSLLYGACLLSGSLGSMIVQRFSSTYALGGGASGAVFGVAAAGFVALRQRGIRFGQTLWGPLLLINLVIGFAIPNVGWGAHVGGLVGGAIIGAFMFHPVDAGRRALGIPVAIAVAAFSFAGSLLIAAPYANCETGYEPDCPFSRAAPAPSGVQPAIGTSATSPVSSSSWSR